MRFLKRSFVALTVCAGAAGAQNAVPMQTKPLDPANMNTSVSACTDFYEYANGGWISRNPVPPAFSNWGGFSELSENNNAALLGILEAAAKNTDPKRSADMKKLGNYYASCMDSAGIEKAGVAPVRPLLNRINAIKSIAALQNDDRPPHGSGNGVLFGFGSTQDAKKTTSIILGANQGGLGLPDRDYYTRTDPASVALRTKYQDHIANILKLAGRVRRAGCDRRGKRGRDETALAKDRSLVSAPHPAGDLSQDESGAARRDDSALQLAGHLPPKGGNPNISSVDANRPFLQTVDSLMVSQPLPVWKAYLRWHILNQRLVVP